MSIDNIRRTCGLDIKVGMNVRIRNSAKSWFAGLSGKVLRAESGYVVVKGATWRGNFHPADIETAAPASPPKV